MKKIKAKIKVQIPAGQATPAPPVGPALAPQGINIKEFCDKFNSLTKEKKGFIIPVEAIVFEDKTFQMRIKQPLTSELLKKAAGIEKGSSESRKKIIGKISKEKIREIAKMKMSDFNTTDIEKAIKIVEGQAKNMGLEIVD